MKKPIISALALSLLPLFFINFCYAQKAGKDSTVSSYVDSYVVGFFNKSIGQQSHLYNGVEYTPYSPLIKSNAYFNDLGDLHNGTVKFDGFAYSDVAMTYDLYKDLLVVQLYNNFSRYTLQSDKVSSFDLDNNHFVYVSADTVANNNNFSSGFYDQLYGGKTQALVKYSKSIQNGSSGVGEITTYFTSAKKQYYLKKGNTYYAVNSEGDILDALKDRKKELQQYFKANGVKFKKAPDLAMIGIATYYDHLSN